MRPMTIALILVLGIAIESPVAVAEPVAEKAEKINLPPGFAAKKRGKYVLYCKQETQIGTRLKTETCYDEAQMRDYLLAWHEMKRDLDRMRSSCGSIC
jgi:hypothetical protein